MDRDWLSVLYSLMTGGGLSPSEESRQRAAYTREELEKAREASLSVLSTLADIATGFVPGGDVIDAVRTWQAGNYGPPTPQNLKRFARENPLETLGAVTDVIPEGAAVKTAAFGLLPMFTNPKIAKKLKDIFGTELPGRLRVLRYQKEGSPVFSSLPSRGGIFVTWAPNIEEAKRRTRKLIPEPSRRDPSIIPVEEEVLITNPLIISAYSSKTGVFRPDTESLVWSGLASQTIKEGELDDYLKMLQKGHIPEEHRIVRDSLIRKADIYGKTRDLSFVPKKEVRTYGRLMQKAMSNPEAQIPVKVHGTFDLENIARLVGKDLWAAELMRDAGFDAIISYAPYDYDYLMRRTPPSAEIMLLPNREEGGLIIRDPDADFRRINLEKMKMKLLKRMKRGRL